MSNILNHNRLPITCRLIGKDYWDFHLHLGRGYSGALPGIQEHCLITYIDTTNRICVSRTGLHSVKKWDKAKSNKTVLKNFGLTGVDNGRVQFNPEWVTDEEFTELYCKTTLVLPKEQSITFYPIYGNLNRYTYGLSYHIDECGRYAKLYGGFYQNFFSVGDGCEYAELPSDIGDGVSFEFELCRKDLDEYDEIKETTLNWAHPENKGIFFYWGTRAENKWFRYYEDVCNDEKEAEQTSLETADGTPLDEISHNLTESDNKFLTYTRTCGGHTVLDDKEGEEPPTVLIDGTNTILPDNPFLIFNRACGGTTILNFDEYVKEHSEAYNIYADLWQNALAFQITDDNRLGYKYLVKDCEAENPECTYKIESEFSKVNNVPYDEWTTIHVRILPCGTDKMRMMFYVDGRLVLYSKEVPRLSLRELNDSSDKQEGVPFNMSLGGGTQGLAEAVYEDWRTYDEFPVYPLEKEFGGSFVGFLKVFRFYNCSLNYTQLNQNVNKTMKPCNDAKIYCGALVFNTKPSKTTIESQSELIKLLNEYPYGTTDMVIRLLPDISKKYIRLVVAVPKAYSNELVSAVDRMNGLPEDVFNGENISPYFFHTVITLSEGGEEYDVWYYTYATRPQYNNIIKIEIGKQNE